MKTINFTKNIESNKVLNSIYESLLQIHDTEEESIVEIKHYVSEFWGCLDYNIYKYGSLLIYYTEIRDLYKGIKSFNKYSDSRIEYVYMRDIRLVVNYILENNK